MDDSIKHNEHYMNASRCHHSLASYAIVNRGEEHEFFANVRKWGNVMIYHRMYHNAVTKKCRHEIEVHKLMEKLAFEKDAIETILNNMVDPRFEPEDTE